jgi:hypothetical protein
VVGLGQILNWLTGLMYKNRGDDQSESQTWGCPLEEAVVGCLWDHQELSFGYKCLAPCRCLSREQRQAVLTWGARDADPGREHQFGNICVRPGYWFTDGRSGTSEREVR